MVRSPYRSPLRERQARATRELIVAACAEVVGVGGELTFSKVAEAAGVQERTVYRHFPSKPDLEAALWGWIVERHTGADFSPTNEDELISAMRQSFAGFEAAAPLIKGMLHSQQGLEIRRAQQADRAAMFDRCVTSAWPGAASAVSSEAAAALQVLYSAPAWEQLRDLRGLDAQAAADAVELAMRAVFKELRRRARQQPGRAST